MMLIELCAPGLGRLDSRFVRRIGGRIEFIVSLVFSVESTLDRLLREGTWRNTDVRMGRDAPRRRRNIGPTKIPVGR